MNRLAALVRPRHRPLQPIGRGYIHTPDQVRHYVRRVHSDGQVTTLCGWRGQSVLGTGAARSAVLCPRCVDVDHFEAGADADPRDSA